MKKEMQTKPCAIVVWYNPTKEYVKNIRSYLPYVSRVIVVDNSESENDELLRDLDNVEYYCRGENTGISDALNFGFSIAEQYNCDYVATFDQDSFFTLDQSARYFDIEFPKITNTDIAVIGPSRSFPLEKFAVERTSVITSGSIVSIDAWKKVGGFNSSLFIDQVDHDFCFRLIRKGYKVIQTMSVYMEHEIGSPVELDIFSFKFSSSNHNPQRYYYIARNRLYLRKEFPDFYRPYARMLLRDIVNIVLIEESKYRKIRAVIFGITDHFRGKYGRRDIG
jgi:rhamnosyltransferase